MNVILFPIIPRQVPKTETVFTVTISKPGGKPIIKRAANKRHSMDLVLDAIREHPDATRISVIKETLQ